MSDAATATPVANTTNTTITLDHPFALPSGVQLQSLTLRRATVADYEAAIETAGADDADHDPALVARLATINDGTDKLVLEDLDEMHMADWARVHAALLSITNPIDDKSPEPGQPITLAHPVNDLTELLLVVGKLRHIKAAQRAAQGNPLLFRLHLVAALANKPIALVRQLDLADYFRALASLKGFL